MAQPIRPAEHDVIIRGASVLDGTGAPARTADVAITDGRIVEVGRVTSTGRQEMHVGGALLTPGFVDIHTHYDGQVTWDSSLMPSSGHGVTTVVMSNCGVGFAPVRPGDHDRLVELMEGVEDIPGAALHEGLAWNWETFPDFLDVLSRGERDIDFAAQVPHGPLRLYVMGERGANREPATDDEIAEMGRLVAEAVVAGALGFTTSRTVNHRTSRGEPTPSLNAARAELVGVAKAMGETGRGVLQVVSDFFDLDDEMSTIRAMLSASGRPLSISLAQDPRRPEMYRSVLAELDAINAAGHTMRAQVAARGIGVLIGLQGTVNPLNRCPSFRDLRGLPLAEQARALFDPTLRAVLTAEFSNGSAQRMVNLANTYVLGTPPDYEPDPANTIAARAARLGREPADLLIELLAGDDGKALLYAPVLNYARGNLDAVAEMISHANCVPGLSDGGAHVGTICDASYPTTMLAHWGMHRSRGPRFELPWLVRQQTRATAETVGLLDRGLIAPGYRADINIIDPDTLGLTSPQIAYDLPANGKRLLQPATGYLHTFVNGIETQREGRPTGQFPGRLVRGAQPDPTDPNRTLP